MSRSKSSLPDNMMPAIGPKKHGISTQESRKGSGAILDIPRRGSNRDNTADVSTSFGIDPAREPKRKIIREGHRTCRDIGSNNCKRPAESREELSGAVLPED